MVQFDLSRQPAEVGDTYVLCSDGLWDLVARTEIAAIVGGDPNGEEVPPPGPSETAAALIELALKRDAPDNVTVAVIRLLAHGPAPSRRSFWRRGV
jgi:protein phosphatase